MTKWRTRQNPDDHRVTTFELYFDLVFVFAFTQVTAWIAHEHSALGVAQGLVLLGLLWWSWCSYTWLGNDLRADAGATLIGMIVAMVAVFLMALSIRDVWSDDVGAVAASVLVSGYIVLRAVHAALYLLAASDDRHLRRQVLVTYCGAAASIALLIVGATVGADARLGWWLAALVLDAGLTWVLAARVGGWRVRSASHFAERFHLVVIVALGESVVAIGVGAAGVPLDARLLVTAVIGILLSVALWWTYFRLDAEQLEHRLALASGSERGRLATDGYTYLHFPLVAGIVVAAAGVEQTVASLGDHGSESGASAILLSGVAGFCAGAAALHRMAGGRAVILVGTTVVLAAAAASGLLDDTPLTAAAMAALVLSAGAATTQRTAHRTQPLGTG